MPAGEGTGSTGGPPSVGCYHACRLAVGTVPMCSTPGTGDSPRVGSGDSPCVVASFASTRQECRVPFASQLRGVVGDSLSDAPRASRLRGNGQRGQSPSGLYLMGNGDSPRVVGDSPRLVNTIISSAVLIDLGI